MLKAKGRHTRESGFSMIEVLVAVLILAVGLLGVAGMQMRALQQTTNAHIRSQVAIVAQDVAERMRVNNGVLSAAVLTNMQNELRSLLGDPEATLGVVEDANSIATITINWSERDTHANNVNSLEAGTFALQMRI